MKSTCVLLVVLLVLDEAAAIDISPTVPSRTAITVTTAFQDRDMAAPFRSTRRHAGPIVQGDHPLRSAESLAYDQEGRE